MERKTPTGRTIAAFGPGSNCLRLRSVGEGRRYLGGRKKGRADFATVTCFTAGVMQGFNVLNNK